MNIERENESEPRVSEAELKRRHSLVEALIVLQRAASPSPGPFPSAEEMVREDRER